MRIVLLFLLLAAWGSGCLGALPTALAQADTADSTEEAAIFSPSPDDKLPGVTARSAIVLEAATGKVLYARDAEARRFPASTTKMMTLIVALEHGHLDDEVIVSQRAAGTEGSTLWLEQGDKIRLGDLLYGIMMMSGNDATVAVAEHISGSMDAFAKRMTEKAHAIGATHTNFVNANGLPDNNHYTTAHDLALIAAYGYQDSLFKKIISTKEQSFLWIKDPKHLWRNENQMLWLYEGANGVKTGYTDLAGRCLVAGAERNGIQLISVVLDATYMWNDSIALLDYGFSQVKPVQIVEKDRSVGPFPVVSGRRKQVVLKTAADIVLPVMVGEESEFHEVVEIPDEIKAPVQAGDAIGRLKIMYEGREIAHTDLLATESIERKSFFLTIYEKIMYLWNNVMHR